MDAPSLQQPLPPPPPAQPPPVRIDPVAGSRLDQLMDQRAAAAADLEAAQARFDAADAAIKSETTLALVRPDGKVPTRIIIGGNAGRPAMLLMWKREQRFDGKRFKAEQAALYERYRTWKGHWEMRKLGAGDG